ncbi:glycosyl hydrolase family 28 [Kribbella orskensis]|uniref:Glycosyl hydrolase family 28 n=1 Tax=Kribbella orskensis TaxID=2512216 RepID=A0ABY2BH73_9ACTN|nr:MULTISPECIES: glycoside hydrolase family 28 protein [Kribbella]TCN38318.1 glycosyl hydrolase family 28 [Kribbella sp. VKM Ac-2500]TCO20152.1 glycosyl hydrolase family 28 [Kribbella orskensis]
MTDHPITEYGARPGTDCTAALDRAIRACRLSGGRVVVPAGRFRTGAIRLRSNIELHVAVGATLQFIPDPAAYPIVRTRWQGIECYSHSPLIYACDEVNVAVTGLGTLDGGASPDTWWRRTKPVDDWQRLLRMVADEIPVEQRVFAPGHGFRPSFIQPYACRRVRIEDVRIVNAPMWVIHPVLSTEVVVRGVTVDSRGPNNDGCNPDSCRDVLISGCSFDTGDDCIALKSGRDDDGRRVGRACENVVIEDCRFGSGHGAVTIGSETSGGVRNVVARDLRTAGPGLDHAIRIKTNSHRGGVIENIRIQDVVAESTTGAAAVVDVRHADEAVTGRHHPTVRGISIDGLVVHSAPLLLEVRDAPLSPVGLTLSSVGAEGFEEIR